MKLQITYDRRFTNSLRKAKRYIAVEFGDRIAAKRLEDNIRKEINKRMSMHSLNIIPAVYAKTKKAAALGEVPIGCVIVREEKIIGRGYNRRNTDKSTLAHAEISAIRKASRALGDWRLEGCTLYVTLEPCQMCAGAIVQARIPETVIGCMNPKAGCAGSVYNLLEEPAFNHRVRVLRGVLEQECSGMLKTFFKGLRQRLKTGNGKENEGGTDNALYDNSGREKSFL